MASNLVILLSRNGRVEGKEYDTMFAFYFVGYVAVAGAFYWRAYKSAPVIEEADYPRLTLWINPEMAEEPGDEVRKAA